MATEDNKDEEYKYENVHNDPEQDDEDFGLPDLDEDAIDNSNDFDSSNDSFSTNDDSNEYSFDTSDTTAESDSFQLEERYDPNPFGDDDELEEESRYNEPMSDYRAPEKKKSSAPVIISLLVFLIAAAGLIYFFFLRDPEPEPVAEDPIKDTTTFVVEKSVEPEPEVIEPEEPTEAKLNILNSRTGRSYVVVGSFFDDDLAKDYAEKLVKQGSSAYVIPPFGKSKFSRVAVEETETFALASTRATELAGQFNEQPWPLKY